MKYNLAYPCKQWAAVMAYLELISEAPHTTFHCGLELYWYLVMAANHGNSPGLAGCPPITYGVCNGLAFATPHTSFSGFEI